MNNRLTFKIGQFIKLKFQPDLINSVQYNEYYGVIIRTNYDLNDLCQNLSPVIANIFYTSTVSSARYIFTDDDVEILDIDEVQFNLLKGG